ncbi:MAG: hypothetical protein AB1650_03650 [Candidatus Omnitrophota bacterium]
MKTFRDVLLIGVIEILIGGVTLTGKFLSFALSLKVSPPNVYFFVITAACTSMAIGWGMLNTKKWAYQLLLYFSSVIFLSKILIFMDIIHLNGALLGSVIPQWINHIISMIYHGGLIILLQREDVKEVFQISSIAIVNSASSDD